jgi:hypothetical protein
MMRLLWIPYCLTCNDTFNLQDVVQLDDATNPDTAISVLLISKSINTITQRC